MSALNLKYWLAPALLLCLVPSSLAIDQFHTRASKPISRVNTVPMPEGGSPIAYLLGAGILCLGAILIGSRATNVPCRDR